MKKFIRVIVIIVLIPIIGIILLVILGGLMANSDASNENDKLKIEVQTLKAEINRLNNEPEILFSKAYDEEKKNRYDVALDILQNIKKKYPDYKPNNISSAISDYTTAKIKYQKEQEEKNRINEEELKKKNEQIRLEDERIAREKELAFSNATGNLTIKRDEMQEVDWYYSGSIPSFESRLKNIYAYIGKKENNIWLRFNMTYSASDWLFVEAVSFKVDGEKYELKYDLLNDWKRDNSSSRIWEWKDGLVDSYTWKLLNQIAYSKKTIMRYHGQQYYSDREINISEKYALKNILLAYEAMGGIPPKD